MAMSRRQRARLFRLIQYAVLAIAIVVLIFVANWNTIGESFFNIDHVRKQFPDIITTALVNTITYTGLGFALGLGLGLILALMKLSSVPPYRWIAAAYIEFFRGIPALLVF